jgi:HEPN domain-containing protein
MSLRSSLIVTIVVLAFSSLACGGDPPDKEIQQAQSAVDAARLAGADQYAVEEFTAATEALKNAKAAVEQRDYRLALNHALDSLERAQNAAQQAAEGRAAARAQAERALTAATTAVTVAETKLKAAETARVPARALTGMRPLVADATKRVQEARTAFERGDYPSATTTATAATATLKTAIEKIEAAMAPPARRRAPAR